MKGRCLPGGEEMKYTEKIHAKRLLGMLNKKNPCLCCPAGYKYRSNTQEYTTWWELGADPQFCLVCECFIGMDSDSRCCPCDFFGEHEAIKRTWLALEEKGYLD